MVRQTVKNNRRFEPLFGNCSKIIGVAIFTDDSDGQNKKRALSDNTEENKKKTLTHQQ